MAFGVLFGKELRQKWPWIFVAWGFLAILVFLEYTDWQSHASSIPFVIVRRAMPYLLETKYFFVTVALCSLIYHDRGLVDLVTASKLQITGSFFAKALAVFSICVTAFLTAMPVCIVLRLYPTQYLLRMLCSEVVILLFYSALTLFLRLFLNSFFLPFALIVVFHALLEVAHSFVMNTGLQLLQMIYGCVDPYYSAFYLTGSVVPSDIVWIANRLFFIVLSTVLIYATWQMLKHNRLCE